MPAINGCKFTKKAERRGVCLGGREGVEAITAQAVEQEFLGWPILDKKISGVEFKESVSNRSKVLNRDKIFGNLWNMQNIF